MRALILFAVLLVLATGAYADARVYYFYGDGCPHCAEASPFLDSLESRYSGLTVQKFETWHNKSNSELFVAMSAACGSSVVGVPTVFVGHRPFIGFDSAEGKGREIEAAVAEYLENGGPDLMEHIGENLTSCPSQSEDRSLIHVPFWGEVDASALSLPVLTVLIGLLDGFNPCAMWVLLFLLTLLAYTKSRRKMLLIGGLFIFVSGLVYYLFMAAWLNLYLLIGFLPYLRIIVGTVAVAVGLINLKEMFFFKKGVSLVIPEGAKSKLMEKIRHLVLKAPLSTALASVIVLAFTVNSIELLCTAGFPAVYTKILTMSNLSGFAYYGYLLLYIIIYMLDDTIVFFIAVYTLSSGKMTQAKAKWLKFVSGLMMLILGLLLIFRPNLLMFG
ncbi:MAG: thioredoxin family protein [archaeon]